MVSIDFVIIDLNSCKLKSGCNNIVCDYVVGVGGAGPGGFREVGGEESDVSSRLGEKFQSP